MNAREWLERDENQPDLVLLGAPISKASISPSDAWATPAAFRQALNRFPLWDAQHQADISTLRVKDLGNIQGDHEDADATAAHKRLFDAASQFPPDVVAAVVGGDNSLTRPVMQGLMESQTATWGLITLDAHHDVRPHESGSSNGSPVRELIEVGLPANRVAQIGIHPFASQREFWEWATTQGIQIATVQDVRTRSMPTVVRDALAHLSGLGVDKIYVDFDIDCVDRAQAPACPASMPGGLWPSDLCEAAYLLGAHSLVGAADFCEVDATRDINDITIRLMAQTFMSFCAGVTKRSRD